MRPAPSPNLNLVVDANIPFADAAFGSFGRTTVLPGAQISPGHPALRTADVLLVRSVTPVTEALLDASALRFVGTATIGTDHVDLPALAARNVAFASAPGSNAESVVEYVLAALLLLAARRDRPLRGLTAGIVGAGNVGSRLAPRLRALGMTVLLCDPPRARAEGPRRFTPLDALLEASDIVSLHTPLTREGPDATHHLLGSTRLRQMKAGAWLVNASRGAVVDNAALLDALERGRLAEAVLDVWENEPTPLPALVACAALATPHIAGYSFDGKVQGTLDLVRALEAWSGLQSAWDVDSALAPLPEDHLVLDAPAPDLDETSYLYALTRQLYDIEQDDRMLRALLDLPAEAHAGHFRTLRRDYPRRRRWPLFSMEESEIPAAYAEAVREGLKARFNYPNTAGL